MLEEFLLAMVLVTIVMILGHILRKRGSGRADEGGAHRGGVNTAAAENGMFRAVSCAGECSVVRSIEGVRFLEPEAPMFPLPGCDALTCRCTYNHHSDRRDSTRNRRSSSKYEKDLFQNSGHPERRNRGGRRATDVAMA